MSSEETTKTEPAVAVATDKSVDKKALNAGASEWKPNASAQEWTPGVNVAMTPDSGFIPQGYGNMPYNPMMPGFPPRGMVPPGGMPYPVQGGYPMPMMIPNMGMMNHHQYPPHMGNFHNNGAPPRNNKNYPNDGRRKDRSGSNLSQDRDGYHHRQDDYRNGNDRRNDNRNGNYNYNNSYDVQDESRGGKSGGHVGTPDRENMKNNSTDLNDDSTSKNDTSGGYKGKQDDGRGNGRERDHNEGSKTKIHISNINVPTDGPIERVEKPSNNNSSSGNNNSNAKSNKSANTGSNDSKAASKAPTTAPTNNWAALASKAPKEKPVVAPSTTSTDAKRKNEEKVGKTGKDSKDGKDNKEKTRNENKKASDAKDVATGDKNQKSKEIAPVAAKGPSLRDIVAAPAPAKKEPPKKVESVTAGSDTASTSIDKVEKVEEAKTASTTPAPAPAPAPATLASIVKQPAAAKPKVEVTKVDKMASDGTFRRGLSVEAELGPVKGKDSTQTPRSGMSSPRTGGEKDDGDAAGWKRGASVPVENLVDLNDGVHRYDKLTILALFQKMKEAPPEIVEQYPEQSQIERHPIIPKHMRMHLKKKLEEEPHPDAALIFDFSKKDENTFQYNAARLADDTDDPEIILNKAQLILNKLSLTKFDKLSDEFMAVGLDSDELMDRTVEMIVSKAQLEEHFCFMYADLCRKMTDVWSAGTTKDEESPGKTFRQKLLDRCRDEFDIDRVEALQKIRSSDVPDDEKEEKEIILKKRYTGHMRFIGELYIKDLVTAKIMHNCMQELLNAEEEETLVCMVKLMKTIGSKLEAYDKKKGYDNFQNYFDAIIKTSTSHESSRMRFMLKDLIDMRVKGWQERREQEKVVDLSKKGSMKNSSSNSNFSTSNLNRHNAQSQDARANGGGSGGADEWHTVPTSGKNKGRNNNSNNNGNGGGSTKSTSSQGNVFSALSNEGKKKEKGTGKGANFQNGSGKSTNSNPESTSTIKRNDSLNDVVKLERQDSVQSNASSQYQVDESLPGFQGSLSKEDIKRVCTIVDEYYCNEDPAEAVLSLAEKIHPNGMSDALGQHKGIIDLVFEKYPTKISILNEFLLHLYNSGFLTSERATLGIMHFLDNFDDTVIDFPKAAVCGGDIIASLIISNIVSLSLFNEIPEENMFMMSFNKSILVGNTLIALGEKVSKSSASTSTADDNAKDTKEDGSDTNTKVTEIYKASGIDLWSMIEPEPNQSKEDADAEFLGKYDLSFLKS